MQSLSTIFAVLTILISLSKCQDLSDDDKIAKIYAIYFPQFHKDKLNDHLWGENYTDWRTLQAAPEKNRYGETLLRPSETIGYYDLLSKDIRKKQGELAKQYGIDGFLIHHYWFHHKDQGAVLAGPLEKMLEDSMPDIPFALNWAKESWTVKWHGVKRTAGARDGILNEQKIPPAKSQLIIDHYQFLRKFFHHKNYIKVHGAPLFTIYQNEKKFTVNHIVKRLKQLAMDDGFPPPGLHIPRMQSMTYHSMYVDKYVNHKEGREDAKLYYPFTPTLPPRQMNIPSACMKNEKSERRLPTYLSTATTFDNTPRREFNNATVWNRHILGDNSVKATLKSFELDLVQLLLFDLCCQPIEVRRKGGEFLLVNAWNEWGEGMALEPSNVYGESLLATVKSAKKVAQGIRCDWEKFRKYNQSTWDLFK